VLNQQSTSKETRCKFIKMLLTKYDDNGGGGDSSNHATNPTQLSSPTPLSLINSFIYHF
jgi:hypothetical protein